MRGQGIFLLATPAVVDAFENERWAYQHFKDGKARVSPSATASSTALRTVSQASEKLLGEFKPLPKPATPRA